jgi:hypothetical protein
MRQGNVVLKRVTKMTDATLDFLKANNLELTRGNYLAVAYIGNPRQEPLDPEVLAEIPVEILRAERRLIARKDTEFLHEIGARW